MKKVGCAAAKYDDCKKNAYPDGSSAFTAEAKAFDLALDFVKNCTYTDKFSDSDSLSVLQAINHTSSRNSQIQHLLSKHHEISSSKSVNRSCSTANRSYKSNTFLLIKT